MYFKAPKLAFIVGLTISTVLMNGTSAQEISESHLAAGRKAVAATLATLSFDAILYNTSTRLKNELTAKDPNQADIISTIVDEEALALAPRRGVLEGEAARLFASRFSEAELGELAEFFGSDAGKKYLANTAPLAKDLGRIARIWANGITRDMAQNVDKRLSEAKN